MSIRSFALLATVVLVACSESHARLARTAADSARIDSIARARQDSINRAQPGYIIDSLLPIDEEMRRFRAAIGGSEATQLEGGSASREKLVRRFVDAISKRDTAELRAMIVTPREFIDLVYPSSPNTHPPYRQSPRIVWGSIQLASGKGIDRLLQRRGGSLVAMRELTCPAQPITEGHNRLWHQCAVRVGDTSQAERLFGTIVEREGRFKFLSYANGY